MVQLENIKKQYDNFFFVCSIIVPKGQVTGLIGRNGAGKSTTFKAMLGLIRIDDGSAHIFGKDAKDLTAQDRERMGVVLADSGFSNYLTIKDLLSVLKKFYHSFSPEEFIKQCDRFGLPLNKKIKEFSTGMKRKLQVLAAISHNANLLVLDEPTAGLDVIVRDELIDMLREYMENGERSIIISSHISSDLEGLCDDVYFIEQGKILMHEETGVLLGDYGLIKVAEEQYQHLDKKYIIKSHKEQFGYSCLTNQKQFYMENYPSLVLEKGSIDDVITMMVRK